MDSGEIAALLGKVEAKTAVCPENLDHTQTANWAKAETFPELSGFVKDQPKPPSEPAAQNTPPAEPPPAEEHKGPLKVIIADDSSQIRELLWHTLTEEGHEVEFAKDGEEVFKVLGKGRFDLLILDVTMPKMNGYKVAEKIVKNVKNRPRILLYTSRDVEKEKLQFYCSEADAIIQKGAPVAEIIATINSFFTAPQGQPSASGRHPAIVSKEDARNEIKGAAWMGEVPPSRAAGEARDHERDINYCLNKLAMLENILEQKNLKYENFIRTLLEEKSKSEGNASDIRKLYVYRRQALLLSCAALAAGVLALAISAAR